MERKKNIIFTDKRYGKKGIMSVVFGLIAMISFVCAVYYTYKQGGQAPMQYGFVAILITIYTIVGIVLGTISRLEKDKFHLFSNIGLVINICNFVGIIWIFSVGIWH